MYYVIFIPMGTNAMAEVIFHQTLVSEIFYLVFVLYGHGILREKRIIIHKNTYLCKYIFVYVITYFKEFIEFIMIYVILIDKRLRTLFIFISVWYC
jgi:hypothetical protein